MTLNGYTEYQVCICQPLARKSFDCLQRTYILCRVLSFATTLRTASTTTPLASWHRTLRASRTSSTCSALITKSLAICSRIQTQPYLTQAPSTTQRTRPRSHTFDSSCLELWTTFNSSSIPCAVMQQVCIPGTVKLIGKVRRLCCLPLAQQWRGFWLIHRDRLLHFQQRRLSYG